MWLLSALILAVPGADPAAAQPTPECYADHQVIPDEAEQGDYIGTGVDIDGDWAIVGAAATDTGIVTNHGAAYLYERTQGGRFVQSQQVAATLPDEFDYFGEGVEISGDVAVMAAPGYDVGTAADAGAIYVLRRDDQQPSDSQWSEEDVLTADTPVADEHLGGAIAGSHHGVAIDGNIIVAGAPYAAIADEPGRAYIFAYDSSSQQWEQEAILTPPNNEGEDGDGFGWSVDISGRRVIIGAPFHSDSSFTTGRAYVYYRDTTQSPPVWVHDTTLTADSPGGGDNFGYAVAIDGDGAVVGAPRQLAGSSAVGYAVLFRDTTSGWSQIAEFSPSTGDGGSQFGSAVSLSGDIALVGAAAQPFPDHPTVVTGTAYLYQRDPYAAQEDWDEAQILLPGADFANTGDEFGISVALDGDDVIIGAGGDEPNSICPGLDPPDQACGDQRGAIYMFFSQPSCP